MEYTNFKVSIADGVATVMLSRPDKLNALTATILEEMDDILNNLLDNDAAQ